MSDLQRMYAELREQGVGHRGAVAEIARRIGVDPASVARILGRAGKAAR